ncbi:DUF1361 domain-containing protein [Emticicia sp. TH156]|uniref:DUF1361 domain-containing protein n=1 Tax=Emticicia sp. TH156 TaxID=2067454 RepID=UPI000C76FA4A|nr:DUF1361 domain-containing protein [Emticicia sp. TH156]PLK45688.1 DUF1361 domain-containing protein [Emticicia sp. TH156]
MASKKITIAFNISRPTLSLILLTLLSSVLLLAGVIKTHHLRGIYLLWNLFLAWVPLFFILVARRYQSLPHASFRFSQTIVYSCLGFWLLFFPNSPYIITDLIHLTESQLHLLWFDAVSFFIVALAGLATGLYSLLVAHEIIEKLTGRIWAWAIVFSSVVLSGFGLYLGRYIRFNSWDLFTNPAFLFRKSIHELQNPLAIQTTMVFSLVVMVLYVSLNLLMPASYERSKNVAKL